MAPANKTTEPMSDEKARQTFAGWDTDKQKVEAARAANAPALLVYLANKEATAIEAMLETHPINLDEREAHYALIKALREIRQDLHAIAGGSVRRLEPTKAEAAKNARQRAGTEK